MLATSAILAGALFLASMSLYFVLSGASYAYFFVWKRARFHPDHVEHRAEVRRCWAWAALSLGPNALVTAPIHVLILAGHSEIYFDVAQHGVGYLLSSIALLLVFTETGVYWAHRLLHTGFLYRHVHRYHHRFRRPTPWASHAFHPLDAFAQALPYHLAAFLFPLHAGVYATSLVLVMVWSISIHDRVTLLPWSVLNYTGHHTVHHLRFRSNYGQYFTAWDRLAGTYEPPVDEGKRGRS